MSTVWQDARYGIRGLVSRPGFTVLAVLTLALGIGAATTIFSVIHNVLLNPFPYTDAHRVVAMQIRDLSSTRPGGRGTFQPAEFLEYQDQSRAPCAASEDDAERSGLPDFPRGAAAWWTL
jgi:hypothetical protein